jgi:hypothetical protein
MSSKAALDAINSAGILPEQIGLIITCTFTGDYVYPAVSCKIQQLIGAKNAGTFDIMANCTGFQVGLGVASDRMKLDSSIKYTLVIGAALQSRFIDWSDGSSSIYFGDGFGAAILGQVPYGYGILSNTIWSNGNVFDSVRLRGGGSSFPLRENNINTTNFRQFINYKISYFFKKNSIENKKFNTNQFNFNYSLSSGFHNELNNRLSYPIKTFLVISSTDGISKIENTYVHILYSIIPRFLWNNKPENKTPNDFGRAYGFIGKNDFQTSINIPIISEAKLNISNISYTLIFPIYVIGLFILQKFFLSRLKKDFFLSIAFYSIFIEATVIENSLAFLIGNIYKFIIFILLFVILSNKIFNILKK